MDDTKHWKEKKELEVYFNAIAVEYMNGNSQDGW